MMFLVFLWAVWGAVVDFRYQKRGGVKPAPREWLYLLAAVFACVIGVIVLWSRGAPTYGIRDMAAALAMLLAILWEFGRWRVRLRNAI